MGHMNVSFGESVLVSQVYNYRFPAVIVEQFTWLKPGVNETELAEKFTAFGVRLTIEQSYN